jgi:hypothetical protein
MKTTQLRKSVIYSISILMLAVMGCLSSVPLSRSGIAKTPTSSPTTAPVQYELTVELAPVTVTHGSTATQLAKGQTQDIFVNDTIEVGTGGYGELAYSNRVNVEIMQGAKIVIGDLTTQNGGRVEITLLQNKGHVRVSIVDNAKADVILVTQDSQITSRGDGSVYSVCYKPGTGGLTCVLVEKGSIEVRDKTTGIAQVYPAMLAGYTFNGKAPQPPVCIHANEYQTWLSAMREGVTVETLGAMVGRWINQSCPGESTRTTPTASSPRPLGILYGLS